MSDETNIEEPPATENDEADEAGEGSKPTTDQRTMFIVEDEELA